jgi:MarR family transcriptional regulator, 2-MHQ and catechol-resistance regulon repressor
MSDQPDFRHTSTMRLTRALVRAYDRWREADLRQMEQYGIHPSEFDVLVHLGVQQPQKMTDLAERTLLTKSNCTRVMKCLERKGLARRERAPDSDREVLASLTPEGEALFRRVYPLQYEHLRALYARRLTEEEQEQLIRLLQRLGGAV